MLTILKLLSEETEEAIKKILENKNYLLKIKTRILRIGYRRLLTNMEWQILNLTCKVIKDKVRSPLLKNKLKVILEKVLPNILSIKEQKIIYHIIQIRNSYMNIVRKLEGAIKNIYCKLVDDWEYLYHKAVNLLSGEAIGAYIKSLRLMLKNKR